jgi:gamma-glutamylcysteine synthetase
MTVAAFHIGLLENLPALKQNLENDSVIYSHGYSPIELQRLFSLRDIPSFADKKALSARLAEILDMAADGLKKRGFGEETFLEPLYERAEKLTNPAREMIGGLDKGEPIERYIGEYARI